MYNYNKKSHETNYKVGDFALKDSHAVKKKLTTKLQSIYKGQPSIRLT